MTSTGMQITSISTPAATTAVRSPRFIRNARRDCGLPAASARWRVASTAVGSPLLDESSIAVPESEAAAYEAESTHPGQA